MTVGVIATLGVIVFAIAKQRQAWQSSPHGLVMVESSDSNIFVAASPSSISEANVPLNMVLSHPPLGYCYKSFNTINPLALMSSCIIIYWVCSQPSMKR
jgi:hypothetical protein